MYLTMRDHIKLLPTNLNIIEASEKLSLTRSEINTHLVSTYLLNRIPAITYRHDLRDNKGCTYISQNIKVLLGYESKHMLGKTFWLDKIHPEDKTHTIKSIKNKLKLGEGQTHYRFLNSNNDYVWILDQFQIIKEYGVPIEIIGNWIDISEIKRDFIHSSNTLDELTGLQNRTGMKSQLQLMAEMKYFDEDHVYCNLDIDKFAVINASCGHLAGDELLRQFSTLLKNKLSRRDVIARLNGDSFGILLQYCNLVQAERLFKLIQEAVNEFRFNWDGSSHSVSVSIGALLVNKEIENVDLVENYAESACRLAKEGGRNNIHIYKHKEGFLSKYIEEAQWVEKINRALEEDRFFLYYQPIVSLQKSSKEKHYELLIRMKDENGQLVSPGQFLPAAERYGLSVKIDHWVIQTALSWLEAYDDIIEDNVSWGINLSGQSLADTNLKEFVLDQFSRKEVLHNKVYFEVTETAAIENLDNATQFIDALKKEGCNFALDDFGSGLSSFAYLKNLPVDYIKIDGVFIKNILVDKIDLSMVEAIKNVAKAMGKRTIAEFVENDDIMNRLSELGIDFAQGYAISKPLPLSEFEGNSF